MNFAVLDAAPGDVFGPEQPPLERFNTGQLIGGRFPAEQQEGIRWIVDHPRSVLADPPGFGKTVMTLGAVAALADVGEVGRTLVLVPEGTLARQWSSEVERLLPDFSVMDSTERRFTHPGKDKPAPTADITVMTYKMASARVSWVASQPWDLVVLDEASALRSGAALASVVKTIVRDVLRVVALTGSPLENHPMETYELLAVLDLPGLWRRDWFEEYVVMWEQLPDDQRKPVDIQPPYVEMFRDYLARYVLRRDTLPLPLPAVQQEVRRVPLTGIQDWAYRKAAGVLDDLTRHYQRTRACAYAGRKGQEESAKVNEMVRILMEEFPDSKAIVWAENLLHLDIAERALTGAGIGYRRLDGSNSRDQRSNAIGEFKDGSHVRVLLGSRVLERGLNLQHCGVLISLGSSWNPQWEAQRLGRICRPGSPFDNVVHITVLSDTDFETKQLAVLQRKLNVNKTVFGVAG